MKGTAVKKPYSLARPSPTLSMSKKIPMRAFAGHPPPLASAWLPGGPWSGLTLTVGSCCWASTRPVPAGSHPRASTTTAIGTTRSPRIGRD